MRSVLDVIEIFFCCIHRTHDLFFNVAEKMLLRIDESIQEHVDLLNARFGEHACGYRYENEQIIKINSEYVHQEMTMPALSILATRPEFIGANEEFLRAHEHYRHSRYKEAISAASNAFESTLKGVCAIKNWQFDAKKSTASDLIKICLDNNILDKDHQNFYSHFVQLLGNGVPTIRNRKSGHGQGTKVIGLFRFLRGSVQLRA